MGFGVSGYTVPIPFDLMAVTRLPTSTSGYPETHGFEIAYSAPWFFA